MARCQLIASGLPKMMWGAAIFHATMIKNLTVRREKEKCPAELMRCISIINLSFHLVNYQIIYLWSHSLHEEEGQRRQQTWTQGTGRKVCGLHWWRQWLPGVCTQYTQGVGSSRCDHQGVRSGLNPWQHRDALPNRWGVNATGDLVTRWLPTRRWQQK